VQGLCWGNAVVDQGASLGWPKDLSGWWTWTYRPLVYGARYTSFAVSGSSAKFLRGDSVPSIGQFMFPAGGFYVIKQGNIANSPNRFQLDVAPPTSGTWLAGDVIWNAAPEFNGPAGWICTARGPRGTWIPLPVAGDGQAVIAMSDSDQTLSVPEISANVS